MGITRTYAKILHRELMCRAAWPPLANGLALGDYGLMSGGVFVALGNVTTDFGVAVVSGPESPQAKLDFVSQSTTTFRSAAQVEVPYFPNTPVDAELRFEFADAESLVLKANPLVTREMQNVRAALAMLEQKVGWRRKYRMVRQLWICRNALILSSIATGARISLRAQARVLRDLDLGNVAANIAIGSEQGVGLHFVGLEGVIGLGLVRLGVLGGETFRSVEPDDDIADSDPADEF